MWESFLTFMRRAQYDEDPTKDDLVKCDTGDFTLGVTGL